MVVLSMRLDGLSVAAEADLGRVARVARSLEPGELLAVRLRVEPKLAEAWPRLEGRDLRMVACSFAPDDHEVLIWGAPPEPPPADRPSVAGELTLDVRPLVPPLALVVPMAAVARLGPGESLLHVSERGPPLMLVELLAGRAVLDEVWDARDRVLARLVRRPAARAGDQAVRRVGRSRTGSA
jgi:hypothetical protein